MFPLFAASPRDPGETPRKVWSVKAAVLISDVWAHFFLWDDCDSHLWVTVSKQLQVQKNSMRNWNLRSSLLSYRKC